MISKVLVAEDHEIVNVSLQRTLEGLGIVEIDHAYYCDDALKKVQVALQRGRSYDLLITDLCFDDDGSAQQITDGSSLIAAVRKVQPDLKIIVFSVKCDASVIEKHHVDGYVLKARNDAKDLLKAIEAVSKNQSYFPRSLRQMIRQKNAYDFTPCDLAIITLLAEGVAQKDIPAHLQKDNIRPSSLSSVEKRLNKMREELNCSKNEQLIIACKEIGIL
ncbi:DNA-binding response regulator [Chitinophaga vietnamensis]|uniref:DNA-binding response regulator n=1 Tax=Chitinophaga vietnamensis TaxID=2593957 RepID=UPI0011775C44|nr:response regulator [Chitinophaga vietnamensis]